MKYIKTLLFFSLLILLPLQGEPHLLLYFDINKTLIASDKASQKSVEDTLNELLAKKYQDRWEDSDKISSYYDYIGEVIPEEKKRLYHHHFVDYLEKEAHPLFPEVKDIYEKALQILHNRQIFPSFFALLEYLNRNQISYSLILRSFGQEIFELKDEINQQYGDFITLKGKFRKGTLDKKGHLIEGQAIYKALRRTPHIAIHDDYSHWSAHAYAAAYGKPFYIDRADRETMSIFFDDNIQADDLYNIIAPIDVRNGKQIPMEELLELGQVAPVDTLEAIFDDQYFIKHVQSALSKWH